MLVKNNENTNMTVSVLFQLPAGTYMLLALKHRNWQDIKAKD